MTAADVVQKLSPMGWGEECTGGGCDALTRYYLDGTYQMLTVDDSPEIPTSLDEPAMLGTYVGDGECVTQVIGTVAGFLADGLLALTGKEKAL